MNERMLERVEENMREFVENTAKNIGRFPKLDRCGSCHYCGEDVRGNQLFCNSECAADYEHEQKILKAQGR
jgi:hypothetical protein